MYLTPNPLAMPKVLWLLTNKTTVWVFDLDPYFKYFESTSLWMTSNSTKSKCTFCHNNSFLIKQYYCIMHYGWHIFLVYFFILWKFHVNQITIAFKYFYEVDSLVDAFVILILRMITWPDTFLVNNNIIRHLLNLDK